LRRRVLGALVIAAFACAVGARAELASRPDERRPIHIAVLGDSLGEGLWASLFRQYWRNRSVKIIRLARASTGFNVPGYDQDLLDLLARQRIDLLIVQTGANDRQRVVGLDGKEIAYFGTERWYQLYGQRLAQFLGTAQQHKVPVLWVGLPIMRDGRYDSGMRVIDRMHQEHAERHGALFLDITDFTADEDGAYAEYLVQANGRKRRLRHQDGVHSWEFGYDRLAAHVAEAIRARFPGVLPDR